MLYRGKLISFGTVYVYSKGKKEDESDTAQQEDGGQGLKIIHYMLLLPVVL